MASSPDHDGTRGGAPGFGELLRRRRRGAGLTQEELARRSGVGVRTVRDLERGRASRPQRTTVRLLAGALGLTGVDEAEFVGAGSGAPPRPGPAPVGGTLALPAAPALIGRSAEIAHVSGLLDAFDLVTLTGLAGVGKSCLALAVVHRLAGRYPGGVAGIAVSEVSQRDDVLAAVCSVFGVGRPADLPERFAAGASLLLVDGASRSPDAVAGSVAWLRTHAPTLRVLITARGPVGLAGGVEWPVPPLEVPPDAEVPLAEALGYPAAAFFAERLRQFRGHPVQPQEGPVLVELVRRLDGLPLALELAAARARILGLSEILRRYGHRVLDLPGSSRTGTGPGGTLRDGVAASYRLLSPADRAALRQLAVFRGRWSVELAEALLDHRPGDEVEDVLDRLVSTGLVSLRDTGELRFCILDVVRDFAVERLDARGELTAARARHARLVAGLVERIWPELTGPTLPRAVHRLDRLASDVRAALDHALRHDPVLGLAVAARLPRWLRFRGRDREGRRWLARLLDDPRTTGADPVLRAWAELGVAMLAAEHGDGMVERHRAEHALRAFTDLGDVPGELAVRGTLCIIWQASGGYEESKRHNAAILALARRSGRDRDVVVAQNNLAWHDIRVGDLTVSARRLTAAARLAGQLGDLRLRTLAQANLAEVARLAGRYGRAVDLGRRVLDQLPTVGDPGHRVRVHGTVGRALAQAGRLAEVRTVLAGLTDEGVAGAGHRAMVEAYVRLGRTDRAGAALRFAAAADALAGQHDLRDVVEALVGLAASTVDQAERGRVLTRLAEVCRRGRISLLPRERALLGSDVKDV